MPENVNTSVLEIESELADDASKKTMVKVDHVSMVFNMASEQLNSIKEYVIAAAKRELRFKEFRALDDVSFEVKQGDVFGILGTNGSGKSTILKIIAGVLEPSKGTCTVNGNIAPLIELGAGFDMELTARENIYLNGALLGYSKQFIEENFNDIVEFAEVEKFLDMPMKNYSSGMVARIAFAIATVIVPEILIVDEVLSVGDFMFQKKCEDRITKLIKEHGVTVLIVSHNNDQIERLCNKAVWIEKGHLRMAGTAQDVCQTYRVLGGHVGSKESEQIVFEALQDPKKPDMSGVESIEADTRYGIAAKLSLRCYPDGANVVLLASGDHLMAPLISNGLASALDAPMLLLQDGRVPDATIQELERIKPTEIFLVDAGTIERSGVMAELKRVLPAASVVLVSSDDTEGLAKEIYEYGVARNFWGSKIAFAQYGCFQRLISVSPVLFEEAVPVLVREGGSIPDAYFRELAGSFEEVLVIADEPSILDDALGFVRPCACTPLDEKELPGVPEGGACIVVSPENPEDAIAAGCFASKNGASFLLENPQSLDSVARSILLFGNSDHVGKLFFLGGHDRFSDADKALLAKAAF